MRAEPAPALPLSDTATETGGQLRGSSRSKDIWRGVALVAAAALLVYLVTVPLGFLVYGTFNTAGPGQPSQLSLETYVSVLTQVRTYRLLGVSLVYAAGAALVSFVIGGSIAWLVQRTDLPGKGVITFVVLFPLFMPTVLTSVSWILLLDQNIGLINRILQSTLGLSGAPFNVNTLLGMIWVLGMMDVPLVYLWLWPAFAAMDPSLEEAASMSRAGPMQVIRTITLPLVLPALAATFLISFVLSLEDVGVAIFIGMPSGINVFASEIYLATSRVPSNVNAASVYGLVLLLITVGLMLLYRRLTYRTERYVTIRGRGYRPYLTQLGRMRVPAVGLVWLVLFFTVGLPLFILVWTSFAPFLQVPSVAGLQRLTPRAYQAILADPVALRGFLNSSVLGLGAGLVVMGLSVIVGWFVIRSRHTVRSGLDLLAFLPIAVPGLVMALSLMWLYLTLPLPIYGSIWILLIAYVTRFIPYGVRLTYSGFAQLHQELEEAAYVSGSDWGKALRTISLPLLAPTLTVGMIYIFLRAFRELSASLMLSSFGNEPYSPVAYHLWASGESAKTAAYGILAVLLLTVVVVGAQRVTRRRYFLE